MSDFIQAFLANFIATILGVVIGIPIGLWTSRSAQRMIDKKTLHCEHLLLCKSLDVIRAALLSNKQPLSQIRQSVRAEVSAFYTAINDSAWEATKEQIGHLLNDPALQGAIAFHFAKLGSIKKYLDTYLDIQLGTAAAVGVEPFFVSNTRDHLTVVIDECISEATDIADKIDKHLASLKQAA